MKFLHKLPRRDETQESSSSNNLDENENESLSNLLPSHEDIIREEIPEDTELQVDIVRDKDSEHQSKLQHFRHDSE